MGFFRKQSPKKQDEAKKEEDAKKEAEELLLMTKEEAAARDLVVREREQKAMAKEEQLQNKIEKQLMLSRMATPEVIAPLPPVFRALEEINEFSVIRCQAAGRRLLAKKRVEGIRQDIREAQARRAQLAAETSGKAAVIARAAFEVCDTAVAATLALNAELAEIHRDAAFNAMHASWVAARSSTLGAQSVDVAPYNVAWFWGPSTQSNIWAISSITGDRLNLTDATQLVSAQLPFEPPSGSHVFCLEPPQLLPPRASSTSDSAPGRRCAVDWESSFFEQDPVSGDWLYSEKPEASNLHAVPPCKESCGKARRKADHLPDTLLVRGLPLAWFGIGYPRNGVFLGADECAPLRKAFAAWGKVVDLDAEIVEGAGVFGINRKKKQQQQQQTKQQQTKQQQEQTKQPKQPKQAQSDNNRTRKPKAIGSATQQKQRQKQKQKQKQQSQLQQKSALQEQPRKVALSAQQKKARALEIGKGRGRGRGRQGKGKIRGGVAAKDSNSNSTGCGCGSIGGGSGSGRSSGRSGSRSGRGRGNGSGLPSLVGSQSEPALPGSIAGDTVAGAGAAVAKDRRRGNGRQRGSNAGLDAGAGAAVAETGSQNQEPQPQQQQPQQQQHGGGGGGGGEGASGSASASASASSAPASSAVSTPLPHKAAVAAGRRDGRDGGETYASEEGGRASPDALALMLERPGTPAGPATPATLATPATPSAPAAPAALGDASGPAAGDGGGDGSGGGGGVGDGEDQGVAAAGVAGAAGAAGIRADAGAGAERVGGVAGGADAGAGADTGADTGAVVTDAVPASGAASAIAQGGGSEQQQQPDEPAEASEGGEDEAQQEKPVVAVTEETDPAPAAGQDTAAVAAAATADTTSKPSAAEPAAAVVVTVPAGAPVSTGATGATGAAAVPAVPPGSLLCDVHVRFARYEDYCRCMAAFACSGVRQVPVSTPEEYSNGGGGEGEGEGEAEEEGAPASSSAASASASASASAPAAGAGAGAAAVHASSGTSAGTRTATGGGGVGRWHPLADWPHAPFWDKARVLGRRMQRAGLENRKLQREKRRRVDREEARKRDTEGLMRAVQALDDAAMRAEYLERQPVLNADGVQLEASRPEVEQLQQARARVHKALQLCRQRQVAAEAAEREVRELHDLSRTMTAGQLQDYQVEMAAQAQLAREREREREGDGDGDGEGAGGREPQKGLVELTAELGKTVAGLERQVRVLHAKLDQVRRALPSMPTQLLNTGLPCGMFMDLVRYEAIAHGRHLTGCTILVPVDSAFLGMGHAAFDKGCWGSHVIPGCYLVEDLFALQGGFMSTDNLSALLRCGHTDEGYCLWVHTDSAPQLRARVLRANLRCEHGVLLHVVDRILLPPANLGPRPMNIDPFDDEEDINSQGTHRVQAAAMRRSVADDVRDTIAMVNRGIAETSGSGELKLPQIMHRRGTGAVM